MMSDLPLNGFSIRPASAAYEGNKSSRAILRWTVDNVCVFPNEHSSPPCYVRGLPWRITTDKVTKSKGKRFLSIYVTCDGDPEDSSWSCSASVKVTLIPQVNGVAPVSASFDFDFSEEDDSYGWSKFILLETLLNPNFGYNANNSVILELSIQAGETLYDYDEDYSEYDESDD